MINIGILTNLNDELLPFLLKKIKSLKNIKIYIIISKTKNNDLKNKKIFIERTGNYFLKHNLNLFNLHLNLSTFLVNSHNAKKFHEIIKYNNIKYLYNSSTPDKINKITLKKVKGIINIHPGILPYYRGCTCPEWALFNKDPLGITAHYMNESYDGGPIIQTQYLKFKKKDIRDYKDIRIKIYLSIIELAKKVLKKIHKIKTFPQDESKSKYHRVIKNNDLLEIIYKIKKKKYSFAKKNLV